jgi:hypothetical protein
MTRSCGGVPYSVVMSGDGYIAGPEGEAEWNNQGPGIRFHCAIHTEQVLYHGIPTHRARIALS